MNVGTRVALAVGAGYVLGRRKKLRPALTLAAAVAVGRASHNAPNLIKYGTDLLSSSPALGNIKTMSKPLASAGKAAAAAAIGSGVDAVSERLRDRADALRHPEPAEPKTKGKPRGRAAREADDRDEPDDEQDSGDDEAEDDEYEEDESGEDESDEDESDEDESDEDEAADRGVGARRRSGTADRTPASSTSANTRRRR